MNLQRAAPEEIQIIHLHWNFTIPPWSVVRGWRTTGLVHLLRESLKVEGPRDKTVASPSLIPPKDPPALPEVIPEPRVRRKQH